MSWRRSCHGSCAKWLCLATLLVAVVCSGARVSNSPLGRPRAIALADEHVDTEWTIPLRSREPLDPAADVPAWLTLTVIWTLFGFAALNTWLSASEESSLAILKRAFRGPHLEKLYWPLLCREHGAPAGGGHWERLREIDRKSAYLYSRQAMAPGTRLTMVLQRPSTPPKAGGEQDFHFAASFYGHVTRCRPVHRDRAWFFVQVRIEAGSSPDSPLSLPQLLASLAPPPLGLDPS